MEAFETTLTGSDGNIDGIVTHISKEAYHFASLDNTLQLTIAKNIDGKWVRLSGSEPYFSGWLDELSERIAARPVTVKTHKAPVDETKVLAKKTTEPATKKTPPTPVKKTASAEKKIAPAAVKRVATAPSIKKAKLKAEPAKKTTATVAASKKGKVSSPATKK